MHWGPGNSHESCREERGARAETLAPPVGPAMAVGLVAAEQTCRGRGLCSAAPFTPSFSPHLQLHLLLPCPTGEVSPVLGAMLRGGGVHRPSQMEAELWDLSRDTLFWRGLRIPVLSPVQWHLPESSLATSLSWGGLGATSRLQAAALGT